MTRAAKLITKVRRSVQNAAYGNPIYQKMLAAGSAPSRLLFTPSDPWPGDAQAGQALLAGQRTMFDRIEPTSLRHATVALRNLRALGTDGARQACVNLIEGWLQQFDGWHEDEWTADRMGSRIAAWIGFYDFYAPAASPDFTPRLTASLHRQWKHLARTISPGLTGLEAVNAVRGLIYGGLNFADGDPALGLACDMLVRQVEAEIQADGGHISRNPSVQLHLLRHLVDIRNVFDLAGIRVPEAIGLALSSMIPSLKFFRHADGQLALFHGGVEESALLIEAVLTQASTRGRILRRLTETGYERLNAGRSVLMVDAGSPPPPAYGSDGHAGLLSFEFCSGRERLIVNCGGMPQGNEEWRAACAATAAHSTVTVADTNACDIDSDGGVIGGVRVASQRFEDADAHGLEMSHDGYIGRFGLIHHRILRLSGDGDTLTGHEIMDGKAGRAFAIRWHLHPSVQASLSQGGHTALLRTASGAGWRLRVENIPLSIESSIYCGNSVPRRTLQIKCAAITKAGETKVLWSLTRERKS